MKILTSSISAPGASFKMNGPVWKCKVEKYKRTSRIKVHPHLIIWLKFLAQTPCMRFIGSLLFKCEMLKLCLQRSLFHTVLMLTGELLSCVFPWNHPRWPCVMQCDPDVSVYVPPLLLAVSVDLMCSLPLLYSDPPGDQPCLFQRFHPHRAEGGQGGHHRRRLHRPVPGKDKQLWRGKERVIAFWMRAELSVKVRERLTHLHAIMHMRVDSAAPHCLLIWRLKEVLLTDAAQLPWMRMEDKALLLWHRREKRESPLCSSRVRHPSHWEAGTSSCGGKRKGRRKERKRHVRTDKQRVQGKAGDRSEMFGSVVTQLPLSSTELLRREPDFLNYLLLSVNRNTHL